jgi:hypothetical protein
MVHTVFRTYCTMIASDRGKGGCTTGYLLSAFTIPLSRLHLHLQHFQCASCILTYTPATDTLLTRSIIFLYVSPNLRQNPDDGVRRC